jgi:hypothetical protein
VSEDEIDIYYPVEKQALIIDEVGMVNSKLLTCIDEQYKIVNLNSNSTACSVVFKLLLSSEVSISFARSKPKHCGNGQETMMRSEAKSSGICSAGLTDETAAGS